MLHLNVETLKLWRKTNAKVVGRGGRNDEFPEWRLVGDFLNFRPECRKP